MKKVYEYYDTDIDGNEEYDIADEQYKNLICIFLSIVLTRSKIANRMKL